jgi:VacB/RNase II family 3'-5' exoribonuclease
MAESTQADARQVLERVARAAMLERGLSPDYAPAVLAELDAVSTQVLSVADGVRDLRDLPWCSIDDEASKDLDQLSVACPAAGAAPDFVLVAIADVDRFVGSGGALDGHARGNTSTVYTPAKNFSMLPERLSTDLSSLNREQDRLALVIEMGIGADGSTVSSSVYRALVRSKARLSYGPVAAWLMSVPAELAAVPAELDELKAVPGLSENLRLQDGLATRIKEYRRSLGALEFDSRDTRPGFDESGALRFELDGKNRANELIENLMIAANGAMVRFLHGKGYPGFCRVVRAPKRWDRIVELAAARGCALPADPDPLALSTFMASSRRADPASYAELSLSVLKLMGKGEYAPQYPDRDPIGHFGLATKDYAHSTAPNRRYSDLVSQRLAKAALAGAACPYAEAELEEIAKLCTAGEDSVGKVERQVNKAAAALILEARLGETFQATITGAAEKGTWLKLAEYPVEGRLVKGADGLDVGDRLIARLVAADPERGYLDFERG